MNNSNGPAPRRSRSRRAKNVFTTKSGTDIRLNRSFADRRRAHKDAVARQRAARLSSLPQQKLKRMLYALHPKRVLAYWFSREGAVMALKITGVGIVVCFLLLVGMFAYFRKDLPPITDVNTDNRDGSVSYYDSTGQTLLFQDYDAVKRIPVSSDKISKYLKDATVAIEDKNFYNQGAFNVRGIARAAYHDLRHQGGPVQGGSTITQQLVKLSLDWTDERTVSRKVKELIVAVEVERSYSKDAILTGYLNLAPYGGIEVGVESTARDFFGPETNAKNLTLAQASLLASIPQSPDTYYKYSPNFDQEKLVGRQHYVLDRMVEQGMITKAQAADAKKTDVVALIKPLQPKYAGIKAPYFVLAAKQELENTYLSKSTQLGGWKINTTLKMDLQDLAEQQVSKGIAQVRLQGGDTAAFVAQDVKTGEVVASVGGPDFSNKDYGELNFAHTVQISPGSTFKPYDYAALIDKSSNVGAGSVLYDTKGKIPGYENTCDHNPYVKNAAPCPPGTSPALYDYDNQFPGPITLRYALGGSRNIPAVKAMLTVGVDKTIKVADDLMARDDAYKCYQLNVDVSKATKKDQQPCYASAAIGDGAYVHLDDHLNGIASLARLGSALPHTYIHSITDAKGKAIELKKRTAKQVVRPDAAYIVNDMASDRRASYLNNLTSCNGPCSFHDYKGWKFAIKTGTTNDAYDGLMTSWSSQYAAITWVGFHTRTTAMTGAMEKMTAPIVRGWMQGAHDKLGVKATNWTAPAGLKTLPAFVVRNKVSRLGESVPSSATDLFPSWYTAKAAGSSSATIDRVSNKLATSCTPEAAKQVVGGGNANAFSVDQFVNGNRATGTTTTATDDIHKCDDAKPSVALTVSSQNSGSQTSVCDQQGCTITVTISAGTHPLSSGQFSGKVTINVNDQPVKTIDVSGTNTPQSFSVDYKPTTSGAATVTATVTDSTLYSANTSQSITLSNASGAGNNGSTNNNSNNSNNDDEDDDNN